MSMAQIHFEISDEELDAIIERRLSEGWRKEHLHGGYEMVIPPIGDKRNNWCAEWLAYRGMYIPHWIIREV